MNSYPIMNLETAGVAVLDCEHKTPSPASEGKPYVAIPDVREGKLDLANARLISLSDFETWTRRTKPQADDVILTRRARVGDTAVIPQGLECALGQNLVILRSDGRIVDQRFLRWLVRGPEYWDQVYKYQNEGAVFSSLNVRDISKFQLSVPPLASQRRIAEILGRLDDKIEVNRRVNRTLERMAQALYKHWFVDFGPFRDGEFVESEVGLAPRGWEMVTVGDVCQVVNGATPSTKVTEYWDGGDICWATPTDMTALTAPVIFNTGKKITRLGLDNCSATLLPVGSVLVTSRATIGISAINYAPIATNQGFKSLICGPRATNHFMLLMMKNRVEEMIGRANGTTFLEINSNNFKALEVVLPPQEVMAAFDRQVKPYFDQVYANQRENVSLARIRDYLLPRLLAGEVEV